MLFKKLLLILSVYSNKSKFNFGFLVRYLQKYVETVALDGKDAMQKEFFITKLIIIAPPILLERKSL